MTMRDRLAERVYQSVTGGCLVPFAEQGETLRKHCYDIVDAMLDELGKATTALTLEQVKFSVPLSRMVDAMRGGA